MTSLQFFGTMSSKFRVYFILTAHLNSEAKLLLETPIFALVFPYSFYQHPTEAVNYGVQQSSYWPHVAPYI